jgi:hypothetical protein
MSLFAAVHRVRLWHKTGIAVVSVNVRFQAKSVDIERSLIEVCF